jgi:hypothetical protein
VNLLSQVPDVTGVGLITLGPLFGGVEIIKQLAVEQDIILVKQGVSVPLGD